MKQEQLTVFNARPLILFAIALLALLAVQLWVTTSKHYTYMQEDLHRSVKTQLSLLSTTIQDAAIRGDLAQIKRTLEEWGLKHQEIISVRALSPTGFALVQYQGSAARGETFTHKSEVWVDQRLVLTLEVTHDLSLIASRIRTLTVFMGVVSSLITLLFGITVWWMLTRYAIAPLNLELTRRRKAEAMIRESQEALVEAQMVAHMGSWNWSLTSGEMVWSEGLYRLLGISSETAINAVETFMELVPQKEQRQVRHMLEDFANQRVKQFHLEHRIRRQDGEVLHVLHRCERVASSDGTFPTVRGTLIDISQSEALRAALAASEEKFRNLFNNMGSGVAIYEATLDGEDFIFRDLNKAGCEFTHLSREAVLGKPVTQMFPGIDQMGMLDVLKRVWRTGEPVHFPLNQYEDDRIQQWVENYVYRLESGEVVAVFEDVTSIKEAQLGLELSERRFREMAETLEDVFWITSAQGHEVLYVNPAFEKVWGYPSEALIEDYGLWSKVIHMEDKPAVERAFGDAIVLGQMFDQEYRIIRPDGQMRWIHDRGYPIIERGKVVRIVGLATDISTVKESEVALKQATFQAQEASQAKSEFLATMSHEIRTPMNTVIGMTEMLLETPLTDEQQKYVEGLRSSGEALLDLINAILDLTKIESGRLELSPENYDFHALLRETCRVMRYSAESKGLELHLTMAPEVPHYLLGDAPRLRQVLINLVGNAVKFTESGSVQVEVMIDEQMDQLRMNVVDTGVGIPKAHLSRIFDMFSQADSSIARKFGGSGLGLTISQRLIQLMGGQIRVDSEVHKGSRFAIAIPYIAGFIPDQPEHGIDQSNLASSKGLNILLAEDSQDNRTLMQAYLAHTNHRLTFAVNGEEAEKCVLADGPFDLILMDVQMPLVDGYTATRRIRQWEQEVGGGHRLPIIALTAHALKEDEERSFAAGCDAHLTKPIRKQRLLEILNHYTPQETPST
ncbi:PAS domain-containing hybrid sensor histidine kinase/response regulator [Magnetococcus sp. PR-3]|uniref:PAS domain-containing hybrid sensor histidine kinase/response regulator n=1 Tax=Magnetococcus sp. PR-3 TaxID=3120355 RepID=UPI002FCE66FA